MTDDEWIGVPEVLRILDGRISKTTLRRWIRMGAFPAPLDLATDRLLWVRADVVEWKRARPRSARVRWRKKVAPKK